MTFLFIVQGEGRGHMTQAISLHDILTRNGHRVIEVLVGKSEQREIPAFFSQKIHAPVYTYQSPNFLRSSNNKGIMVFRSIVYNLKRSGRYFKSISFINARIKETKPDAVINFYELIGGLTYALYKPKPPHICIGHQLLLFHPHFVFPSNQITQRWMLKLNTWLTSLKAKKQFALSFTSMPNIPNKRLFVVPPLLRKEVLEITPDNDNYILGYMLNAGYAEEIVQWHNSNPKQVTHFFWDKKDADDDIEIQPNLHFHRINDFKFLLYMKGCKGYASTAGFESICEAMYLRKPILMVPTAGHYEQKSNSIDAIRAGAGISCNRFDLNQLLEFIPKFDNTDRTFTNWVNTAEKTFLDLITEENN